MSRRWGLVLACLLALAASAADATLAPFGGRFLIHGGRRTVLEGEWTDDLIVIAFPDLDRAHRWYRSPAYKEILGLRRAHAEGDVIIIEGVGDDHRATDILNPPAPSSRTGRSG